MGEQGIGEGMHLHIGVGVGLHAALDEGEANDAVPHRVAILAVVEEADTIVALGEVHPLLAAALEPGLVPGGVGVDLPGHVAKLDLKGGLVGMDIHGELRLQQVLVLLPVRLGLKVNAGGVGIKWIFCQMVLWLQRYSSSRVVRTGPSSLQRMLTSSSTGQDFST